MVRRWTSDALLWLPPDEDAETEILPDAPETAALHEALTTLTEKQREVIELHFFEGMSQGEIARKLGITQQVVQKRLHGAPRKGKVVGGAIPRLRRALGARHRAARVNP